MSEPLSERDEAARKLARARMELVLGHPFFGAMALRLALEPDAECEDVWTDGVTLGYNPRALAWRSDAELTAMLAHAILHVACEHHLRRRQRDAGLWNKACDLAINGLLVEAGFTLPKGYPVDAAHAGQPAEAIYAALLGLKEEARGGGGTSEVESKASPADSASGGGEGNTPFAGKARTPAPAPAPRDLAGASKRRNSAPGSTPKDGQPG